MPPTPGGGARETRETTPPKRATWADRVRDKLPPLGENEYEVLWERGVLGVIFLESEKDGIPYVSKATESCISPMVAPGDILKFVNHVRSKDHSFSDFFKILATMKKPVLLRFERPSPSSASTSRSGSPGSSEPMEQRSVSATDMNGTRASNFKDAARALAAKVNRSNSLPPAELKPVQKTVTRGAFWRGSSARDPQPAAATNSPMGKGLTDEEDDGSDTSDSPRGDDDDDDTEFHLIDVYWETGSLGLFFGEERGTGQPVVTRSTAGVNPSVHRKVQVNDVLLMANGIRSADYTFEAFFARLQQMNKPVKLVFRRKGSAVDVRPPRERQASVAVDPAPEPPIVAQPRQLSQPGSSSRPSRLPPPVFKTDVEPEKRPAVPSPVQPAQPSSQQNANSSRQEHAPSPKPRSTSVGDKIIEEERIPTSGSIQNLRGKSPSSRPDIVSLGSPKRKSRPPPPVPPAISTPDHLPSPRETPMPFDDRLPSPQRQHPYTPSPTGRNDVSRMSTRTPTEKPNRVPSPIYVLGDDFDHSPIMGGEEEDAEDEHDAHIPTAAQIVEEVGEDIGGGVEEGVAVGVPFDPVSTQKEDTPKTRNEEMPPVHVDAAAVADAIFTAAFDEAVSQANTKTPAAAAVASEAGEKVELGLPVDEILSQDENRTVDSDAESDREASDGAKSESESDESEPPDALEQEDPDIAMERDGNDEPKTRESLSSPSRPTTKSAMNASLAKYKKRPKNSRPLVKLPVISEAVSQTVPLVAPNAVNTNVQVRGRAKPKPSLVDTPDSSTYLVKWKEGRGVGLQLREVRLAKGTFPLVVDVCKEPCCEALKHVCVGDVIVEINSRNCSTMGVKKTVTFLKTSSKTMLLKFRRGPAFTNERVSASL